MKLLIVDETDSVIATKSRDETSSADIYRVARLVIINSKGQLLLAQRASVKQKDPGLWGLAVEGTVEAGENYESNIRKESSGRDWHNARRAKTRAKTAHDRQV